MQVVRQRRGRAYFVVHAQEILFGVGWGYCTGVQKWCDFSTLFVQLHPELDQIVKTLVNVLFVSIGSHFLKYSAKQKGRLPA
jgi:hypothetical protein